jgi:hypothetical protein
VEYQKPSLGSATLGIGSDGPAICATTTSAVILPSTVLRQSPMPARSAARTPSGRTTGSGSPRHHAGAQAGGSEDKRFIDHRVVSPMDRGLSGVDQDVRSRITASILGAAIRSNLPDGPTHRPNISRLAEASMTVVVPGPLRAKQPQERNPQCELRPPPWLPSA